MSTDRSPFAGHLADDTLLLLGDVIDEAALTELVHALAADDAFGSAPGLESAESLTASWRHLDTCPTCTSRRSALMGSAVESLAAPAAATEPQWSTDATDARIAAALDQLTPSSAARADDLTRSETTPVRRSWFAFGLGRRGDGADVSPGTAGGAGALTGRRLLIGAAAAAFAVGTVIALRPHTSQVGALKASADTTSPADGFSAAKAAPSVARKQSNDASATETTSVELAAEAPAAGAGAAEPATTAPVAIAGAIASPVPAPVPDAVDEAAATRSSSDPLTEDAPTGGAVVDTPVAAAPPAPAPAPTQSAVPAPARKTSPATTALPAGAAGAGTPTPAPVVAAAAPELAANTANTSTSATLLTLGTFASAEAALDRFAALHPATPPASTAAPAPAPAPASAAAPATGAPQAAIAPAPASPSTQAAVPCSTRGGDLRSTATIDGRPVVVLRVREAAADVDVVLDASSCVELGRRSVAP